MHFKSINPIIVFIFSSFAFSCCSGKASVKEVSVNNILENTVTEQITIQRFDSLLFLSLADTNLRDSLQLTYPNLLSALGSVTINEPNVKNNMFFTELSTYFNNDVLSKIYSDALAKFKDIDPIRNELSQSDQLIQTKLTGKHLPKFSFHVSGFKANTIVTESEISISIDKYLGYNYPIYQRFFEPYQRMQMQPQFLTRDLLKAWLMAEFPSIQTPAKSLLEEMIYEGKILYALSELLPEWTMENIIGYDSEQFQWCINNEVGIWKSIIDQKHLYNNEYFLNQKYIADSPFTSTISTKSPGRIGCWVGFQIISAYAKNTGRDVGEILATNDSRLILKESRYNPI